MNDDAQQPPRGAPTFVEPLPGAVTRVEPVRGAPTVVEGAGAGRGTDTPYVRTTLPPDLRDEFEVVEQIPVLGAEADVLVVRSRATHEQLVVKVYRLGVEASEQVLLDRLALADPAHVVQVLRRDVSAGTWFEIMEFCSAGSLARLIREEGPKLPVARVEQILREIVPALRHVHAEPISIAHRDFKPDNVLIRTLEPFDLVLGDFGLSTIVANVSKVFASTSCTPAYAAPEAVYGVVTPKLDWWSLGITLVEMLTGTHPVAVQGIDHLQARATAATITAKGIAVDGVDDERWRSLCAGLTTVDPEHRWGGDEVDAWLRGENPRVHRPAPAGPAKKITPFTFRALDGPGRAQYRDPVEVAAALGRHWDDALGIVRNDSDHRRESRQLRDFLRTAELTAAEVILTSNEGTEADRLLRLRLAIDPDSEPMFAGVDLGGDQLRRRAQNGAAGDGGDARLIGELLDHGVLTLYDGSGPQEGWAALEARWSENATWLEAALVEQREHLQGAGDLDEDAIARNRSRILHLLLDAASCAALARDGDRQLADRRARGVDFYPQAVDRIASGPRPARDILVGLLHGEAIAVADRREAERRAAEQARREQQRKDFGKACTSTVTRAVFWCGILFGGAVCALAFGLLMVPEAGKPPSAELLRTSVDVVLPAGLPALIAVVASGIAFNLLTVVRGKTDRYASPAPAWQARVVFAAVVVVAAWVLLAAKGVGHVAVVAPGWVIVAGAIAQVLCLVLRAAAAELRESTRSVFDVLAPPVALAAAILAAGLPATAAVQAETDSYISFSENLASALALEDCAGTSADSRPLPSGWLKASATCRWHGILIRVKRTESASTADLVISALLRQNPDPQMTEGASCLTGQAVTRWRLAGNRGSGGRNGRNGRLLCYRRGPYAHLAYTAGSTVIDLRRKGDIDALYRWWQRRSLALATAAAEA